MIPDFEVGKHYKLVGTPRELGDFAACPGFTVQWIGQGCGPQQGKTVYRCKYDDGYVEIAELSELRNAVED